MKEIFFYIPSFHSGGAERVAAVLLNYWYTEKKYQIKLINTTSAENDLFDINENIIRKNLNFSYNKKGIKKIFERFSRFKKLRNELKKYNGNTVVSFLSQPSMLLILSSIGLNKKIICCEHTNYYGLKGKINRTARNILYLIFTKKITVLTKTDVFNYPKFLQKKIVILPNPLGTDGTNYSKDINISSKTINLLFVGRLSAEKGIDRLCEIIKNISTFNWQLNICGDGVLNKLLKDFIIKNNLSSHILLHGNVKNIDDFYKNSDLLLMTSYREGLPMVIAEAMSFGIPVIAYDCPTGPREFIKHNINGLLIENGNVNQYINQLNDLLKNKNKIKKLSSNTKNTILKYKITNIDKIWDKIIDE